eukprot:scaffold434878_cov16-Prasinocladus_malaysianus.AAC.1
MLWNWVTPPNSHGHTQTQTQTHNKKYLAFGLDVATATKNADTEPAHAEGNFALFLDTDVDMLTRFDDIM